MARKAIERCWWFSDRSHYEFRARCSDECGWLCKLFDEGPMAGLTPTDLKSVYQTACMGTWLFAVANMNIFNPKLTKGAKIVYNGYLISSLSLDSYCIS